MVFSGLVTACRLAIWPTRISDLSSHATTDGVSREPSSLTMTLASLPSITATTLFVVPRSIPMILPIGVLRDGEDDRGPPNAGMMRFLLDCRVPRDLYRFGRGRGPRHPLSAMRDDAKLTIRSPTST